MNPSPLLVSIIALSTLILSCNIRNSNSPANLPIATASAPQDYQHLLKKYVSSSGVRYDEWTRNPEDLTKLKSVTNYYAEHAPPTEEQESLAWYLNAYNAWILQKVFDNWPNEGPLDVSLFFFRKKSIQIAGQRISFSQLENDIIREQFNEPRIHFALNCASRSCPALHNQPFTAATLDATLEKLTVDFVNDNAYAILEQDDAVQISKIFDWYNEDFGGEDQLLKYINQYRIKGIPNDKNVQFLDYNWKLNKSQ